MDWVNISIEVAMAKTERQKSAAMASIGIIFTLLTLCVALTPKSSGPVAVIANPFSSNADFDVINVILQADGELISGTPSGRIVIAQSKSPGFVIRLYKHGAFLVFNPRVLAGCQRS